MELIELREMTELPRQLAVLEMGLANTARLTSIEYVLVCIILLLYTNLLFSLVMNVFVDNIFNQIH